MATSDPLWTIRPKPKPLESLSSWIIRIADAHGQRLHSFCTDHWRSEQLWNRDLDHHAPYRVLHSLASGTGIELDHAQQTTFATFEGLLHEGADPIAAMGFVRPLGVYHRTRKAYGQQVCPECLATDTDPYFRLTWRLMLFPLCTDHATILLDHCGNCAAPVIPHRGRLASCHICSTDFAAMPQRIASASALALQRRNEDILRGGAVISPASLLGLHPLLYFRLLRCLAIRLVLGRRRDAFRQQVGHWLDTPLNDLPNVKKLSIGTLDPQTSHDVLKAVACLLDGWPAKFIGAAQEARLWQSWAAKDISPQMMPFAYADVVSRYLRIDANEARKDLFG